MRSEDFEQLFSDLAEDLFSFLAYRTGDRAAAEDLVADTFERALRARRRYDPAKASEKTWLYSIALNCLRDRRRRAETERRALERVAADAAGDEIDPGLARVEERERLLAGLSALTEEEREAVALRFGGDLTLAEIATLTGLERSTVEGRVYRALRKMREALD
jgi:RNA polymerase sigma-70 factor (ECF subfamily)